MHHRKHGAQIPWCGLVRYNGLAECRFGTVFTPEYDPKLARTLLEKAAAEILPPGFSIGHIERGALIYKQYSVGPGSAGSCAPPRVPQPEQGTETPMGCGAA